MCDLQHEHLPGRKCASTVTWTHFQVSMDEGHIKQKNLFYFIFPFPACFNMPLQLLTAQCYFVCLCVCVHF